MIKTHQHGIVQLLQEAPEPALALLCPEHADVRILSWPEHVALGPAPVDLPALMTLLTALGPGMAQFSDWLAAAEPRAPFHLRVDRVSQDGARFCFAVHIQDNHVIAPKSVLIRIEDITAACEWMEKIDNLTRLASAGQVAADVAHEFNNILTAMLGWTQIAQRSSQNNPDTVQALKTIEQNMLRARKITSELLDITRPQYDTPENVNVGDAVDDVLQLLSLELKNAHIRVEKDIVADAVCSLDSARLAQVFINVIRNALDATPPHGSLQVRVARENDSVRVVFTDSGSGIPREILDRVFQPFFTTKAKGDPRVHGGSGLGLSICRKIIEEFGGTIEIESRRPGGTSVMMSLPATDAPTPGQDVSGASASMFPPGVSVLVMDDEPDICEMIHTALTLRGADVVQANNGTEALHLCRTRQFDAAFLDFSVEGISGHELTAAIAALQPALPIVFMSGADVPHNERASHVNFLKKPFDLNEIQNKLQELLFRQL